MVYRLTHRSNSASSNPFRASLIPAHSWDEREDVTAGYPTASHRATRPSRC